MELTQILVNIILVIAIIFLIFIAIGLFKIFRLFSKTLDRLNAIVEGFEKISSNIENKFEEVVSFFGGLKTFLKVMDKIRKGKTESDKEEEE